MIFSLSKTQKRLTLTGFLILFIFLLLKSQSINFAEHNLYFANLSKLNEIDARINQNVLKLRYGLLNYYDPVTNDLKELQSLQTKLKEIPDFIQNKEDLQKLLDEHERVLIKKQNLIQDFNSRNAILRNSLSYFPITVADSYNEGKNYINFLEDYELLGTLNQVLEIILIYSISPSDSLIPQIQEKLKLIAENREALLQFVTPAKIDAVLLHAGLILEYQPQVNSLIRQILDLPTGRGADSLSLAYDQQYQAAINTINIYRLFFYLVSVILILLISTSIILKLRKSSQIIRQAEAKYRSIFENSIDGIFQSSPEGKVLSANPSLAKIYGYDSPEDLMNSIQDIAQQIYVDPQRRTQFINRLHKFGEIADFESQVYRRDGEIIWVSENARPVLDSQGNVLYYEGNIADITARKRAENALLMEQKKSELLLQNILPKKIAKQLKQDQKLIAESFDNVTVLFADIVGFTNLSSETSATELVNLLNQVFSAFDLLVVKYDLEKIKTIGDAYMVVGGVPTPKPNHAEAIADMAIDILTEIEKFNAENNGTLSVRIGINTGPVVAGVIGIKKFAYDLWGDTVNTASRMESHSVTGQIQVTENTYKCLENQYLFLDRRMIDVKGKGKMRTYFLVGKKREEETNYLG